MNFNLEKTAFPLQRKGPLLTIIMDGIGIGKPNEGNAVFLANTPVLDQLFKAPLYAELNAHGTFVGLPDDSDMGNSEVGHNAIGAGRVFAQGAKLVNQSIESGALFNGEIWKKLVSNVKKNNSALHFIGLLSDGNVHSHIEQLKKIIKQAAKENVQTVFLHALLDGRDVGETTALVYIEDIEKLFSEINKNNRKYRIASGGGRMKITMDRYEAEWGMVQKGWNTHVEGEGRFFKTAAEAVETLRRETKATDQFLDPFVIAENNKPIGPVQNDSVIFFNFRGDRAIEISRAFTEPGLSRITRKRFPQIEYAGIMEYDGDLHIPAQYLVTPPAIDKTIGEYLVHNNIPLFALSETQKFGHVTYFWNGNRSGKFSEKLEDYFEITSDLVPFEQRPWMKCADITDQCIALINSGKYKTGRINFPNGDMVGHTGDINAARISVEALDICLGRLLSAVKNADGMAVITADHGNADEMFEYDKKTGKPLINSETGMPKAKTSHTLNQVPFIIYDPAYKGEYEISKNIGQPGLANIAATLFNLLGYNAPEDYNKSLITFKRS